MKTLIMTSVLPAMQCTSPVAGIRKTGAQMRYTTIAAIVLLELLLILLNLFGGAAGLEWVGGVGELGLLVGLVLYGAAILQARVLPRWCGILFIIFLPVGILVGDLQPIWGGLVWLALGYALWSQRGLAAEEPSRVR